jgi:hypothetical protein
VSILGTDLQRLWQSRVLFTLGGGAPTAVLARCVCVCVGVCVCVCVCVFKSIRGTRSRDTSRRWCVCVCVCVCVFVLGGQGVEIPADVGVGAVSWGGKCYPYGQVFKQFFFFSWVNRTNILLVSGPLAVEENAGQVFHFT